MIKIQQVGKLKMCKLPLVFATFRILSCWMRKMMMRKVMWEDSKVSEFILLIKFYCSSQKVIKKWSHWKKYKKKN